MTDRIKYTFTVEADEERKFRETVSRLDPEEYTVIKELTPIDPENPRRCNREAILEMEPEAALTFRLGMKYVKIRRERTEEELAEEQRIEDMNTVKITVKVPGLILPGAPGSSTPGMPTP